MTTLVETMLNRVIKLLGSRLGEIEDFFGCPFAEVDALCLRIAIAKRDLPEWLRGRHNSFDLPRRAPLGVELKHYFFVGWQTIDEQADTVRWVVEHTKGLWSVSGGTGIWLNDDEDAVLYKLTFS